MRTKHFAIRNKYGELYQWDEKHKLDTWQQVECTVFIGIRAAKEALRNVQARTVFNCELIEVQVER